MITLRLTFTFLLFIVGGNIIAQVNPEQTDLKPEPWDIGCDSFSTQLEMNVCSYNSFILADSVLTARYNILLAYLDNVYTKGFANVSDSSNAQKRYVEALKQEKHSAMEAQKA
ncbi:MAG: hypothetical protein H7259_01425, partial [Cytophagales bacterium]|nr:hypothetical protein [Cytophaga sp.]